MMILGIEFLLVLMAVINLGDARAPSRVIDGEDAANIPYQVSLQSFPGGVMCGGVILDSRHILTAAHCLVDANNNPYDNYLEVVAGTADKDDRSADNVYQIEEKIAHEDYNERESYSNDIGIVKLSRGIKFNKYRKAIRLPVEDTPEDTIVMASGWGATGWDEAEQEAVRYPRYLQMFYGKVISEKKCRRMMPDDEIHHGHICAWWKGHGLFCKGDSGGPLVAGDQVVGITSFNEYCHPDFPNIYTRVYHYVDWIRKVMDS